MLGGWLSVIMHRDYYHAGDCHHALGWLSVIMLGMVIVIMHRDDYHALEWLSCLGMVTYHAWGLLYCNA